MITVDIENIKKKIIDREPKALGVKYKYAVLIPMIRVNGQWEIIYELRASTLNRQPGEISFPGGKVEKGETYEEAAIRETVEELNIEESNIEIVGELDYFISHSDDAIHSFLGIIDGIDLDQIDPSKAEVDHIFTVPLDFFIETEPEIYYIELNRSINKDLPYNLIPNGEKYNWQKIKDSVYFYMYEDYVLWGYTAKMTNRFIEIIKGY